MSGTSDHYSAAVLPTPWLSQDRARQAMWAVILLSPLMLLVVGFMPILVTAYFGGIGLILLVTNPRLSYALFMLAISVYATVQVGPLAVIPADVMFMITLIATILDLLLRDAVIIRWSQFDLPFAAIAFFTYLSIPMAHDVSMCLTPALRIIVIYLGFRITFKVASEVGPARIIVFYIVVVTLLAATNAVEFIRHGGQQRIFGIANVPFETLAMTALPMSAAWVIWSASWPRRLLAGVACLIIGFGILGTQSRGPLVAVVTTLPVMLALAVLRVDSAGRRRVAAPLFKLAIPLAIVVITLVVFQQSLFAKFFGRINEFVTSFVDPQGTVMLRVLLWSTAVKAFVAHPFLGIGIGNFRVVDQIIPDVRMTPVWYYVSGMSTHNVTLQYLAETGIFGCASLLWLAWRGLREGWRGLTTKLNPHDTPVAGAIFAAMFVLATTILYMRAWTWGQDGHIMGMLLGLCAAWTWGRQTEAGQVTRRPVTGD
jgi:O-antigen ligase